MNNKRGSIFFLMTEKVQVELKLKFIFAYTLNKHNKLELNVFFCCQSAPYSSSPLGVNLFRLTVSLLVMCWGYSLRYSMTR